MRRNDFGPVPVSRMKPDAKAIFGALADGRRVLLARHGEVVAAIDPAIGTPVDLLADYALHGPRLFPELSAGDINQGSPSAAVTASISGTPSYVTKNNRVVGFLHGIAAAALAGELPSAEQVGERERRLEGYLADNPAATSEELVSFTEELDCELGISDRAAPGIELPADDAHELRVRIEATAHDYATQLVDIIGGRRMLSEDAYGLVVDALEARTTEAMAQVAGEAVASVVVRVREESVLKNAAAVARERAGETLASLVAGDVMEAPT